MKKRVIVCLVLSLAMLLTVLAGCSGGGGGRFSGNFKKATEEQKATAIKKIEKYAKKLKRNGFDTFIWFDNPTVELQGVIV